jgi:hypothetical protein
MSDWFPFAIKTRDDLPEGWVFVDRGDGKLEPLMAFLPDEEDARRLDVDPLRLLP